MKRTIGFGPGKVAPTTVIASIVEQARARGVRLDGMSDAQAIRNIEAHCVWVEQIQQTLVACGQPEAASKLDKMTDRRANAGKSRQHTDLDTIVNLLLVL